MRISQKIRSTELLFIENTGRADVYSRLSQDTVVISQATTYLFLVAQAGFMVTFSLLYLAWLSFVSFTITMIAIVVGAMVFLAKRGGIAQDFQIAASKESEFFDTLSHLLDGFKELKVNRNKSDAIFSHLNDISDETELHKVKAGIGSVTIIMFSDIFLYILVGTLIFFMPAMMDNYSEVLLKTITSVLFVIGPLGMVVSSVPMWVRAHVAVGNIMRLEASLDTFGKSLTSLRLTQAVPSSFRKVRFEQVVFNYTDKEGKPLFTVGPMDFTIKRGEVLFIIGGNGSGKSTLLKLLTGLYYPFSGEISVDGDEVDHLSYPAYRELFSIIFTDFHLFDRLYGMPSPDEKKIKELLKQMELDKKTKYLEGKFTNLNLSTGQKKRLAFIAAVLEDRPIYVFDEWAADQDPQFRKFFYDVLLRGLKDQGKTVIAVTHDDKYFYAADRVLKMEYGKLVDYNQF
jgi:putative pyoverdin transport system ATP-binding/permease protein